MTKLTREKSTDKHLTTNLLKMKLTRSWSNPFSSQTVARCTTQPNLNQEQNNLSIKPSSHRDIEPSRSLETHQSSRSHPTMIAAFSSQEDSAHLMILQILDLMRDNRHIKENKKRDLLSSSSNNNKSNLQERWNNALLLQMCKTKMVLEVQPRTNSIKKESNS